MTIDIGPQHRPGPPGDRTQHFPPPPVAGFDAHHGPQIESFRPPSAGLYDSGLRRVPIADRRYFFRQGLITAALAITAIYYGQWRVEMFGALGLVAKGYVVVEALLVATVFVACVAMAKRTRPSVAPALTDLSVDVIIPVAEHSVEEVQHAIDSVTKMRWAHRLVVCNDGPGADGDNWRTLRSACHDRGIRCLTRFAEAPDQAATLNHALDALDGDIVMVVEPHRAVAPDATERMIGWFGDPSVGFVCGPDEVSPGSKDPIGRPDAAFTKTWEPSRDMHGLALTTGLALYRRVYLDEVGGFVSGSNPALFTSKRLHTHGYHSVYEPDPIATVAGPSGSGEALQSLRSWVIDALSIKSFPPGVGKIPRRVRSTYRLTSMYFPVTMLALVASLAPAFRIFSGDPFYVVASERDLAQHVVPWALVLAAVVWSWAGLHGGIRWMRSLLFAQSSMAISGWASGNTGYGAANDRSRQYLPEPGSLLLVASLAPAVLLASVVFGLVDSRPGGSAVAIALASGLLVLGGGPLLHGDSPGYPFLRWTMYLICGAAGAVAIATAYFAWQPPNALLASVIPPPPALPRNGEPAPGSSGYAEYEPLDAAGTASTTETVPSEPPDPALIDLAEPGASVPDSAAPGGDTGATDNAEPAPNTLPPDIDPPAPGPVDHVGTLGPGEGIYVGLTAPDPPANWDRVVAWPAEAVQPQILHWYQTWASEPNEFRNDLVTAAQTAQMTPLISWQAWDPPQGLTIATAAQPDFSLARVIAGDYNDYIDEWARSAAAYEAPILLRPFQDPNGGWYPWSVGVNDNKAKQYRQAWRHVVQRFAAAGADNVGFVWSLTPVQTTGGADQIDAYYPGDAFVDWVAVSGFVWEDYGSWSTAADIPSVFSASYEALQARDKPIMFIDVGATQGSEAPATWVGDAMRYFSGLADLRAVIWFDRSWDDQNDFTLTLDQRADLGAAVDEVDVTVAEGGLAAEGLSAFLPEPNVVPGSTSGK